MPDKPLWQHLAAIQPPRDVTDAYLDACKTAATQAEQAGGDKLKILGNAFRARLKLYPQRLIECQQ